MSTVVHVLPVRHRFLCPNGPIGGRTAIYLIAVIRILNNGEALINQIQ